MVVRDLLEHSRERCSGSTKSVELIEITKKVVDAESIHIPILGTGRVQGIETSL